MKASSKITWIIIESLFLIVFNICFFLATANEEWFSDGRTNVIWLNYGCVHFAYLSLLLSPLFIHKNVAADVVPSTVAVVFRFVWIELFVSCVLIAVQLPLAYNMVIQTILIAAYITRFCILFLVNQNTSEHIARHEQELEYVKTAEAQLRFFLSSISDKQTVRHVEQLYDYIRTSPLRSCSQVQAIEQQILAKVSVLTATDDAKQITSLSVEILRLAKLRNQQLLILNKKL